MIKVEDHNRRSIMSDRTVTIREIARSAGVSPSTVFRALKKESLVKPATRAKVLAAQRLLQSEKAQDTARSNGSSITVGIIMPVSTAQDIDHHPSMFVTVTSFLSELSGSNISNSVLVFDENTMRGEDLLPHPMDGYLIIGTNEEQEKMILPVLSRAELPCVLINRHAEAPRISCVNIDDMAACANATRYLISLGHKRIAYLSGSKNFQHTKRRQNGYVSAMNEAGLGVRSEWVINGDYSETSGYTMGTALARLKNRPTAAICASDTIAIGCIHAMEEKGIAVPADFSVVGFGDIESSRIITPALTTVAQPSVDIGTIAAKVLMQMIRMPIIVRQQLMLQTRMIIRNSAAAAPEE